jgi:YD repeat-containing protein
MKNKISYLTVATLLTYSSINAVAQNLVRQQELKNELLRKQHQLVTQIDNSNQASKKKYVYELENTTYYQLGEDGQWYEDGGLTNYQYDSKHNLIHEEEPGRASRDYTYDSHNNLLTRLDKSWDGTSWQDASRWTYTYNPSKKLLLRSVLEYKYNGVWAYMEKDEFSYNASDKLLEDVFYLAHNNVFQANSKRVNVYNSANQMESTTSYGFDYSINDWSQSSRSLFYYNASGNNDVEIMQNWTGVNWVDSEKAEKVYNADNLPVSQTYYYKQDSNWIQNIISESQYDENGNLVDAYFRFVTINLGFKATYSYVKVKQRLANEDAVTGINNLEDKSALTIFPNPSAGAFKIDLKTKQVMNVEVYNATGAKVLEQRSTEVNLENIAKGIYFVKVYDGEQMYERKILIE